MVTIALAISISLLIGKLATDQSIADKAAASRGEPCVGGRDLG